MLKIAKYIGDKIGWQKLTGKAGGGSLVRSSDSCSSNGGTWNSEQLDHADRIWLDVGAHLGERTLDEAKKDIQLTVYAFEPNLKVATELFGEFDNFIMIPMAVAEVNGFSSFFLNTFPKASSLLSFNPEGLEQWEGKEKLGIEKKVTVPTVRIDTFLDLMGIEKVDLLKIDAQGGDFAVVVSAGERIKDIRKIVLEVVTNPIQLYSGAANKPDIMGFLKRHGFQLSKTEEQSYGQEENLTFVRPDKP